jgi:predicted RecA/RadA family phage recombinase
MKNAIAKGNTITLAAPAAVQSGDIVEVGSLFGVAIADAESGDPVTLELGGVYDLPKTGSATFNAGDPAYLTSGGNISDSSSGNTLVGVAADVTAAGDETARVRLNDSF